jgi:hypothetical protein
VEVGPPGHHEEGLADLQRARVDKSLNGVKVGPRSLREGSAPLSCALRLSARLADLKITRICSPEER